MDSEVTVKWVLKELNVTNTDERKFSCWGTVEVKDADGEIIPREEISKIMDIMMDRGAPIIDSHSNRQCGKLFNWQEKDKKGKPGILLTGKIFDHYKSDEAVWNKIKSKEYKGLSFGGATNDNTKIRMMEGGGKARELRELEGYEFSVCKDPSCDEATFEEINMLAKSKIKKCPECGHELDAEKDSKSDIEKVHELVNKPFGEYSNFSDCVSQNQDKESPEGFCAFLHERVTGEYPGEKSKKQESEKATDEALKARDALMKGLSEITRSIRTAIILKEIEGLKNQIALCELSRLNGQDFR